jgi:hypothetical protein
MTTNPKLETRHFIQTTAGGILTTVDGPVNALRKINEYRLEGIKVVGVTKVGIFDSKGNLVKLSYASLMRWH